MSKTFVSSLLAAIACCSVLSMSVNAQLTMQQAEAAYKSLSESPAAKIPVHTATTSDGSRFCIIGPSNLLPPKPPAPTPTPTPGNVNLAVKLWFEIVNGDQPTGRFVNPEKYKFQRMERFRIWMDSATPITTAISQYYPNTGLAGKPVYPDTKYPSTFGIIPPGKPYPLPVLFAMDDTLEDEHMMIAISDAATKGSGIAWTTQQMTDFNASTTTQAATQVETPVTGGSTFVNTSTTAPTVSNGTSRFLVTVQEKISTTAATDLKAENRFVVVGPQPTPTPTPVISEKPSDVQSILVHANGTGVATLQLHKD